jgi:hypothetical protein
MTLNEALVRMFFAPWFDQLNAILEQKLVVFRSDMEAARAVDAATWSADDEDAPPDLDGAFWQGGMTIDEAIADARARFWSEIEVVSVGDGLDSPACLTSPAPPQDAPAPADADDRRSIWMM